MMNAYPTNLKKWYFAQYPTRDGFHLWKNKKKGYDFGRFPEEIVITRFILYKLVEFIYTKMWNEFTK